MEQAVGLVLAARYDSMTRSALSCCSTVTSASSRAAGPLLGRLGRLWPPGHAPARRRYEPN